MKHILFVFYFFLLLHSVSLIPLSSSLLQIIFSFFICILAFLFFVTYLKSHFTYKPFQINTSYIFFYFIYLLPFYFLPFQLQFLLFNYFTYCYFSPISWSILEFFCFSCTFYLSFYHLNILINYIYLPY